MGAGLGVDPSVEGAPDGCALGVAPALPVGWLGVGLAVAVPGEPLLKPSTVSAAAAMRAVTASASIRARGALNRRGTDDLAPGVPGRSSRSPGDGGIAVYVSTRVPFAPNGAGAD